ncbi:hypothetical protein CEXT_586051 [Caerostris extrusa]|uniref:Uncharacterized protein n=1 Tax=Caerostris extrusa TaxID=172846 RepID=A0AAV4QR48_CAEEX|nr:hypothetical protein CEXT_586051 [Caerostris extrusa]
MSKEYYSFSRDNVLEDGIDIDLTYSIYLPCRLYTSSTFYNFIVKGDLSIHCYCCISPTEQNRTNQNEKRKYAFKVSHYFQALPTITNAFLGNSFSFSSKKCLSPLPLEHILQLRKKKKMSTKIMMMVLHWCNLTKWLHLISSPY